MNEPIQKEILQIKKDLVKSVALQTLGKTDNHDSTVLETVLFTWFEKINDEKEFEEKYEAFEKLLNLKDIIKIYKIAYDIYYDSSKNIEAIKYATNLYYRIIGDKEYKELTKKAGYSLSKDFSFEDSYYDSTLIKHINFVNLFKNKIEKIYSRVFYNFDDDIEKNFDGELYEGINIYGKKSNNS